MSAFLFLAFYCTAQDSTVTLTGKVTDKESALPLAGITVYVNNTTYSTQTGRDGKFLLSSIPLQSIELIFSAINYETQSVKIDARTKIPSFAIRMQKSSQILDEVIVKATEKNSWAQYGTTFTRDFLSYSPFSDKCKILNPQVLKFRINKKENILKAYAREPLKIKNEALGYELTYWLEEYEHRFLNQIVLFKGYTMFAEMQGNRRKQNEWNKNRNTAYYGSLTHFLRSVYEGNTAEQGFIINLIKTVNYKDLDLYIPAATDTLTNTAAVTAYISRTCNSTADEKISNEILEKAGKWTAAKSNNGPLSFSLNTGNSKQCDVYYLIKDPLSFNKFFAYRFAVQDAGDAKNIHWESAGAIIPDNKTILKISGYQHISPEQKGNLKVKIFFSRPLHANDFVRREKGNVFFQFDDSWQITYTKEMKEDAYITENAANNEGAGYQLSVLSITGDGPVILLPGGYYTGAYSLLTGAYWSYEKVDKMLPLDFKPAR